MQRNSNKHNLISNNNLFFTAIILKDGLMICNNCNKDTTSISVCQELNEKFIHSGFNYRVLRTWKGYFLNLKGGSYKRSSEGLN